MRRKFFKRPPPRFRGPRVNNQIRVTPVRVINENGNNLGVMETADALRLAQQAGLDLLEIGPDAKPPVCRIIEYGKFKYEQEKKARGSKQNQRQSEVKGIRITLRAAKHDLDFRARQLETFLNEGHKVKIEMVLRGRERSLDAFSKEKFHAFLSSINVPYRLDHDIHRGGRGLEALVTKV